MSTMTQNPAGIGVYRHSDIGLGFSVSFRNNAAQTNTSKYSNSQTKGYFDYFGYVGAIRLNGALRTFNWGVSYNRLASFDRRFSGYSGQTSTSLSNYIASFTDGTDSSDMLFGKNYNPYLDSSCDWLSTLAYNSMMINNNGSNTSYSGLYQNGTVGDADFVVRQTGYVDEYNIDFGGNVSDVVYWGIGIGITDLNFTSETKYSESMSGALVYSSDGDNLTTGNAGFGLTNCKYVQGTGTNIKLGVILRPTEMLRFGFAVHTPTWMRLTSGGDGIVTYNYTPDAAQDDPRTLSGYEYTDDYEYDWRLHTPWRFMVGASAVIGSNAIVSLDYERVAYDDMKVKYATDDAFGTTFVNDESVESAIKKMTKASNIIRLGLEYRITRSFSARAGFNYMTTNVSNEAENNQLEINTAGTDPSYILDKNTYNICLGLGYRYKSWYIDMAYQHTNTKSTYHAYTPFAATDLTPAADISTNLNNIVISTGFKF